MIWVSLSGMVGPVVVSFYSSKYAATYSAGCATDDVTGQGGSYERGDLFARLIQSIVNANYNWDVDSVRHAFARGWAHDKVGPGDYAHSLKVRFGPS
jgi:hypothetical protein